MERVGNKVMMGVLATTELGAFALVWSVLLHPIVSNWFTPFDMSLSLSVSLSLPLFPIPSLPQWH